MRLSDGRLIWQTPLARVLMTTYFGGAGEAVSVAARQASHQASQQMPQQVPQQVLDWLRRNVPGLSGPNPPLEPPRLIVEQGARRLTFRLHQQAGDSEGGGDWLLVMQEVSDVAVIEAISLSFRLTGREAEVLYWVVKGKINRDIADILGASPATIKKHLEHVFAKLGVETRTAAAGMAMSRIRQLHPQFEA